MIIMQEGKDVVIMKFSNGQWLIREGYQVISPVQAFDFYQDGQSLSVFGSPRPIVDRTGQLDTPLLEVNFSSPMKDVIRVQIHHFKGGKERGPHFEVYKDDQHKIDIKDEEEFAALNTGDLTVKINKKDGWALTYEYKGERITGSGHKSIGHIISQDKETYMREQLDIEPDEYVYGLGERFTPFIKNGQVVDIWNKDGGTATEQSYKNIPFYLTNKGYGVFINHPEHISLEVASENVSKVQFSVPGQKLDYFIIGGTSMKEVLENYAKLTGKPSLPPAWTFGLWLSTSFTTNYDEATVNSFVDGMAERELPVHVFHFDCFWMKEFHWTNFEWDDRIFPDPEGMLRRLKEDKELKICVWINPYIAQRSALFDEGKENGYLVVKENGDVWQWDLWQPGMGLVDFTNPEACEWFAGHLRRLVRMGVDSFKTDFGERIPTDVVYHDGSDPNKMHNYYTYLYNKVVFDVLKEELGEGEAALFARSATAGSQQFPVHWGGDCAATFPSMAESLRGGLSLGMSGFGYWSHDIGGFESNGTADVYKRWVAFGLLSSHSRLHGSRSYRVPWAYDDEAVDVLRHFTKLKCRFMPYLFNKAVEASEKGIPMMRSMVLEFSEDPTSAYLDRQYMLGDSLLVSPIFNEQGIAKYYLPLGTWTDFITGEKVEGGVWKKEHHDYMSVPLFVRPNSVIAVGNVDNKPDYDYANQVEFQLFELADGNTAETTVYTIKGEKEVLFTATRDSNVISIKVEGATKPWTIQLRGVNEISSVSGAIVEADTLGVKIIPTENTNSLHIVL